MVSEKEKKACLFCSTTGHCSPPANPLQEEGLEGKGLHTVVLPLAWIESMLSDI